MKSKISITLSDSLIHEIEEHKDDFRSRSDLVEAAVERFIAHLRRREAEQRDIEIMNRRADELNAEAEDALEYQVAL